MWQQTLPLPPPPPTLAPWPAFEFSLVVSIGERRPKTGSRLGRRPLCEKRRLRTPDGEDSARLVGAVVSDILVLVFGDVVICF